MLVQCLFVLLLLLNYIDLSSCNQNEGQDLGSYLIDQADVRGIRVDDEIHWTVNLGGSYIIESVRINASSSLSEKQKFWMTVHNKEASHLCNQSFIEESASIVITCKESLVTGRQLTVITSYDNDDLIENNVIIDLCSETMHPIVQTNFIIDSSSHINKNINEHNSLDKNSSSCLSFSDWLNYSNWITISFKAKLFVEKFAILGIGFEIFNETKVQIGDKSIPGLSDDPIEPSSTNQCFALNSTINNSFLWNCDKAGVDLLISYRLQPSVKEFSICEFLIFGYVQNGGGDVQNNKNRIGKCNFKVSEKIYENNSKSPIWLILVMTLPGIIIFFMCFALVVYIVKVRFNDLYLKKDLQTNRLHYHLNRKLLNGEMDKEFAKLPKEDIKPFNIGISPHHLPKNRFRNIIPFDDNLVTLGDSKSDYINASFIEGFKDVQRAYIVTQSPKTNTLNDFWNLVWQYKVDVIVMLMQLVEGCSKKCEQYWPNCYQREAIFGKIIVTILKECQFSDYVRRHLIIKLVNSMEKSRAVVHMQFLLWTNYQVPVQCFPLLNFMEQVNSLQKHSFGPLLIHCSAGVGRSGTYIAIDYLIKQAEAEGKVSVYKCVKDLRLQRMNMVQNKKQYVFIYEAIREACMVSKTGMHCIDFIKKFHGIIMQSSAQIPSTLIRISQEERTRLFKVLKKISRISLNETSENSDEPKTSNNGDNKRIKNGSISKPFKVVSIEFHSMNDALILTHIPLSEKCSEFWRTLWKYNVDQILLLEDDEKCSYWPTSSSIKFDEMCVRLKMENKVNPFFTIRKFVLINENGGDPMIKDFKEIIQYQITRNLWQECSQIPSNKHHFQKILKQLIYTNKKIIMQCLNGIGRCGLTAAAMLMIDMIILDEIVDPFLACRYVLASRPEAITSQEQYDFLHELALECIKDTAKYSFLFRTARTTDLKL